MIHIGIKHGKPGVCLTVIFGEVFDGDRPVLDIFSIGAPFLSVSKVLVGLENCQLASHRLTSFEVFC